MDTFLSSYVSNACVLLFSRNGNAAPICIRTSFHRCGPDTCTSTSKSQTYILASSGLSARPPPRLTIACHVDCIGSQHVFGLTGSKWSPPLHNLVLRAQQEARPLPAVVGSRSGTDSHHITAADNSLLLWQPRTMYAHSMPVQQYFTSNPFTLLDWHTVDVATGFSTRMRMCNLQAGL